MATPIDTIISVFENKAAELREKAQEEEPSTEGEAYLSGKSDGYRAAADFLKDLQKMFN